MSIRSKLKNARIDFINRHLSLLITASTYNKTELLVRTDYNDFPYMLLSLQPLSQEQGKIKLKDINEVNQYHEMREKTRQIFK